jgi:carbonic anhydrase
MKNLLIKSTVVAGMLLTTTLMASDVHHEVHWGYKGEASPIHWGSLKPEYARCADGKRQSPVDLKKESAVTTVTMDTIGIDYVGAPLDIINNGHTIQVNSDGKSTATLGGKKYKLLQFHFHAGSEHTVDGKQHPMEVHLVHQSEDGELGVIGIFMDIGAQNSFLKKVFDQMPKHAGERTVSKTEFLNASELLPVSKSYYHYLGSLTTPPCTQIVEWFVLQEPITISKEQLKQFETLYSGNFRPTQEMGSRKLLKK